MVGERNVLAKNVGKCGIAILALEGGGAVKHLIDENAERPPVDSTCMAATLNNFWRNVFLGADERVGAEVGDARSGIDGGEGVRSCAILADNHGWFAAEVRLF